MPYGSISDLPLPIQHALPSAAQRIFVSAFNSAYEDTCKGADREACANKIAWAAVKKAGYTKNSDGDWAKSNKKHTCDCKHGECGIVTNKEAPKETHDAILQVLNRKVGKHYFPAESFEQTVSAWDGIPIVFSERDAASDWPAGITSLHPAFEPYATVIKDTDILNVNGAVIGEIRQPRIDTAGHHKLVGELVFTPEKAREMFDAGILSEETYKKTVPALEKARELMASGRLSHSTGFTAPHDKTDTELRLSGSVVPNHLLVFEEDPFNQPVDQGAIVLNKQDQEAGMSDDDTIVNAGRVISAKNKERLKGIVDSIMAFFQDIAPDGDTTAEGVKNKGEAPAAAVSEPDAVAPVTNKTDDTMDESIKKELDETKLTLANKDTEIGELKGQIDALTKELETHRLAQKEAAWQTIKNKLPPGMVHKPEDEAETRKLFESDPVTFTNKILDIKTAPETKEEGQVFSNKEEAKNDPMAAALELRTITGRISRR